MASIEGEPSTIRVSVPQLTHDLTNGGNTPERRKTAVAVISHIKQPDPSKMSRRVVDLTDSLERAWRKEGDLKGGAKLDTEEFPLPIPARIK